MAGGLPWSCSRSRFLFFGGPHILEDFALGEPLREAHLVQPYALVSSLLGAAHGVSLAELTMASKAA